MHCHEPVGKLQGYNMIIEPQSQALNVGNPANSKTHLRVILETALDEGELVFSPHWDYFLCLQPSRDLGWVG